MNTVDFEMRACPLRGIETGQGPDLWLCLHGFGNDRNLFRFWANLLPEQHRMLSLDLPLFGESPWTESNGPFRAGDFEDLRRQILAAFPETVRIHLLGYSLGAKFGLGFYEFAGDEVASAILIAPDGLKILPMYAFCVYNPIGKLFFQWITRKPRFFLFMLRILLFLRLIPSFTYRFVMQQFREKLQRERVRTTWITYAGVRPSAQRISELSRQRNTKWDLIWGKNDVVLSPKLGLEFVKRVSNTDLHLVDGGHAILKKPDQELLMLLEKILDQR